MFYWDETMSFTCKFSCMWSKMMNWPPHTNWCSGLLYLIPLILNLTISIVTKIAIPFWVLNYSYFIIAKRFHKWKQMYGISKLSDIWISFKLCQAVHELCSWPFLGRSFCYMGHIAWKSIWGYTLGVRFRIFAITQPICIFLQGFMQVFICASS